MANEDLPPPPSAYREAPNLARWLAQKLVPGNFSWVLSSGSIAALQAEVDAVEADVSTLQTEMNAVEADIVTLQGEMNAVEADVVTLETEMDAVEADVVTLQGEMNAVEADVATLETEMDAVEADIATIDGRGSVFLTAGDFHTPGGLSGAVLASVNGTYVFSYADAAIKDSNATAIVPDHWGGREVQYRLYWFTTTAAAGAVRWQIIEDDYADGSDTSAAKTTTGVTETVAAQNIVKVTTLLTLTLGANSKVIPVQVRRNGTAAADTHTGTAHVLGLEISLT